MRLILLVLACLACSPSPTTSGVPGDDGVELWEPVFEPAPDREPCSDTRRAFLLEPGDPAVVDCNLSLAPDDVVTRRLILSGPASSGVALDCNGAELRGPTPALVIRSRCDDGSCEPVHDVTVSGCNVRGSVYVYGLSVNGNGEILQRTHDTIEHVSVVRGAAPYRVTLDGLTISGVGPVPLYLGPGVHDSEIRNTTISGRSASSYLYLGAETIGNLLSGLTVDASRGERQAVSFDGSSDNVLEDSEIISDNDGAHFFRNCGEAGVSRHATPSGNRITGNIWRVDGNALVFGSHGGTQRYCDLDDGVRFGSGQDDRDWSRRNTGTGNRFIGGGIRIGDETNTGNEVE
jgi:hypothetical protein